MALKQPDSTWGQGVQEGNSQARLGGLARVFLQALRQEGERLFVWSPLLLVAGIWIYFSLATEPPMVLSIVLAVAVAFVLVWRRHHRLLLALALAATGFIAADLRVHLVATPLLRAYQPDVQIKGTVFNIDVRNRGRYIMVLDVATATSIPVDEKPRRVRVTVSTREPPPLVGQSVALKANVAPLPRAALPGGFDYGRALYFQSIGATARSTGPVTVDHAAGVQFTTRGLFHDLRSAIGARIRAVITGPLGAFADALITGERAAIPRAMIQSLQNSGLYHILSISGFHMSLVAGGAFWLVRALLALSTRLALLYPIKKWAAIAAVVVGWLYMLLADSGAATERSFIMIAVVFFAVLVDRPALSLHNLAVAALLILLWEPEQAVAASFQMSFMAVLGLAAFFAFWKERINSNAPPQKSNTVMRFARKSLLLIVASLATSLIAGILSGIPAAHHFGRLAPYSVVANALALPIVGVIVMPMAMASVLLMPLGLEAAPLTLMQWGLELVMLVSDWVASWPQAGLLLPRLSSTSAALLAIAAALICIATTQLRWLAVPITAFASYLAINTAKPVLLIDERAANVAVMTAAGLVPARGVKPGFSIGRWLQENAESISVKKAAERPAWTCDSAVCKAQTNGKSIAYLLETARLEKPCPAADILIAQYPLRRSCKGRLATIDRFDVWRNGAHAVFIDADTIRISEVRSSQGKRPWVYEPRAKGSKK